MGPSREVTQLWEHSLKEISVVLMKPQLVPHNIRLIDDDNDYDDGGSGGVMVMTLPLKRVSLAKGKLLGW